MHRPGRRPQHRPPPRPNPHWRAFDDYRKALHAGSLPDLIARDRVGERIVRDWNAAWAARRLPPEALDIVVILGCLETGRVDLLDSAEHTTPGGWLHSGALMAAPGWIGVWVRQQPRHRPPRAPAVAATEQVVIGARRHRELWRVTSSTRHARDPAGTPASDLRCALLPSR